MEANKGEQQSERTNVTNLLRNRQSGKHYVYVKAHGKQKWRTLKTEVFSVAKLRFQTSKRSCVPQPRRQKTRVHRGPHPKPPPNGVWSMAFALPLGVITGGGVVCFLGGFLFYFADHRRWVRDPAAKIVADRWQVLVAFAGFRWTRDKANHHFFISGDTGSGKTSGMNGLLKAVFSIW